MKQSIASLASEDAPLDLVLAIDVSGSMERSLDQVKAAVKQLLSKLRNGDAATLVGFNDTMFLAAEREKDQKARERAVDLLSAWGGTALYDATVRAVDLVSREWGRKGIVIFSDGDDRNSLTPRETATARVQASDAMLYTVGFGGGATVPELRTRLENYAKATGGRAFFPQRTQELDGAFDQIVAELANQYVLSYASTNFKQDNGWRKIKVRVRGGKYDIRARQGIGHAGHSERGGNESCAAFSICGAFSLALCGDGRGGVLLRAADGPPLSAQQAAPDQHHRPFAAGSKSSPSTSAWSTNKAGRCAVSRRPISWSPSPGSRGAS